MAIHKPRIKSGVMPIGVPPSFRVDLESTSLMDPHALFEANAEKICLQNLEILMQVAPVIYEYFLMSWIHWQPF